jgi:acyl carrier protein
VDRRDRVREFVTDKVRHATQGDVQMEDSESLLLSGLVNSLTIVEIILFVETEFGVDITANGIQVEDFDSVDSICALLDRHSQLVRNEDS